MLLLPGLLSAAAPVVSNVRGAQRAGTKLIDITYDLSDPDSATVFVSIQLFANGTALPAFSLSGDVGAGVTPGFNKKITWNAGQDWNRRYTSSGSARIIVDDMTTTTPSATMAYVPAGFSAGSYGSHGGSQVFTSGFYMDKTEVSRDTWETVKAWALANGYTFDNPGVSTAANHPVVGVSWYDVVKWCNARSEMEGLAPVYFTDASRTTVYRTGQVILRSTFCNFTAPGYRPGRSGPRPLGVAAPQGPSHGRAITVQVLKFSIRAKGITALAEPVCIPGIPRQFRWLRLIT